MILLADEGVDQPIVEHLRGHGHQVTAIAELAPSLPDDEVLRMANDQHALLLTQDRDFGELVFRLRRAAHGVLPIRLHGVAPAHNVARVSAAVGTNGKALVGQFSVLSRRSLRIRALPEEPAGVSPGQSA